MSNASLKEQLQAVASQLSDKVSTKLSEPLSNPVGNQPVRSREQKPKRNNYPPQTHHQDKDKAKKVKPKWLEHVQYGVELLKAYFPACFKDHAHVQPLKKGVKQDLVKRLSALEIVTEDKACMVKSLTYYVNTAAYHKSVVEGAARIDLDGHPTEKVSAEEAKYSTERQLAKLQSKSGRIAPVAVPPKTALHIKEEEVI